MMGKIDERLAFYATAAISLLALISGIAMENAYLVAICAAFAACSLMVSKSWYIIETLIFAHSNMIELCGGYELSGSREVAVRKEGYNFIATAAALLEGASKHVDQNEIEGLIARTGFAFKFVTYVKRVSAGKMLDSLATRRAMKEIELGKLGSSRKYDAKRSAIKREIDAIGNDIEAISSGAPLRLVRYITTTAIAQSRIAAEEAAKRQIRELMSGFSAISGSESRIAEGSELINVIGVDA
ncbi:MAG: hypothetical protein QXW10_00120 [Candidatus Micrarchaeaceae archaeon]